MTHFVCGVIVPNTKIEFAEEYINEVLEKYSESYEVEPYIEKTKEELIKEFEGWKKEMSEKLSSSAKLKNYELRYVENGNLMEISLKEWLGSWCGYTDFDENGNLISTFNNNSFFDYHRVGGRWSGLFYGKNEGENEDLKENTIPVKDLIKKYQKKERKINNIKEKILRALSDEEPENNPYLIYIVVVGGKIYRARNYGWFGTYNQETDEDKWKKEYLKLLEEHKEDFMINLDCHI